VLRTGGTTSRKPDALDEFLEARAASIETSMGADSASASMSALKADAPAVLEAFADVLRRPAFAPDRLKIAVTAVTAAIARQNDSPQGIASREFSQVIHGDESPFGRTATYASIGAVTRDDLLAWHTRYFHPNRVILGIVGDITVAEARALVTQHFGDWPKGPPFAETWPAPRTTPQPGVYEAVKADSTQSFVIAGHQGELLRTNPDYFPVVVMNEVLSGGFTSRLFGKIRTELGLAYSVGGAVGAGWTRVAPFQMTMSTRTDATVKAIEALVAEARALASTRPATDAELKLAKSAILNSFVFNSDSPAEVLGQQLAFEYYGQPLDWLDRYRAAIEKVTAADVARVARKYIHPDRLSIVVVGPAEGRDQPLTALGKVMPLDIAIPPPPAAAPAGAGASAGPAAGAPSADAKAKGQALVARAVEGLGGAAAVDGATSVRAEGQALVKTPQGDMTITSKDVMVFPDRFRQEMTLPIGVVTMVMTPGGGFVITPQGEGPLPASVRDRAQEQLARVPLLLLRQRTQPGFEAVASGADTAGDTPVELVTVTFQGKTTTLGIDPKTGHVVSVRFRGPGLDGAPADIVQTFTDFRPVDGLTLPFAQTTTTNGEVNMTSTLSTLTLNAPVDDAVWKPKGATP
jgi:predicted Zn-dependent peptidase